MVNKLKKHCIEAVEEDPLIKALSDAKGKCIEVMAFGTLYTGTLIGLDLDNGTISLTSEDDKVILEIERIESFCLIKS
ncbi:MAG: hypothetical protein ABH859_05105 [Pseudomonadota bacterium]